MDNSNIYAAWAPEDNEEQSKQAQAEQIRLASSMPVIEDVIAWFDSQIAVFKDPTTIEGVNISSKPEDVKQAVLFAQSMIAGYTEKRNEFITQFRQFIEEKHKETDISD